MKLQKYVGIFSLITILNTNNISAIGLGEATVYSSMNDPLDVEIEIIELNELTKNELLSGLPDRQQFNNLDIEYTPILSDLKFNVSLRDDETGYIHITSQKPIKEPVIQFPLEFFWPTGKMIKEYVLLIDPPVFNKQPIVYSYQFDGNQEDNLHAFEAGKREIIELAKKIPENTANQSFTSKQHLVNHTVYTVKPNDQLWEIAQNVQKSNQISIYQTMIAIQNENPSAFLNNNINGVKSGAILRIPSENNIQSVKYNDAVSQVMQQNQAWKNKNEQIRSSQRIQKTSPVNIIKNTDHLSILGTSSNQDNSKNTTDNTTELEQNNLEKSQTINLLQEQIDKKDRENTDIKNSLLELKQQVDTLQSLIKFKDEQLEKLKATLSKTKQLQLENTDHDIDNSQKKPENSESTSFTQFLLNNLKIFSIIFIFPIIIVGIFLLYNHYKKRLNQDEDSIQSNAFNHTEEINNDENNNNSTNFTPENSNPDLHQNNNFEPANVEKEIISDTNFTDEILNDNNSKKIVQEISKNDDSTLDRKDNNTGLSELDINPTDLNIDLNNQDNPEVSDQKNNNQEETTNDLPELELELEDIVTDNTKNQLIDDQIELNEPSSELNNTDDQLDLARAYIDMGDNEGATELLNEIIEVGDKKQIKEAKKLLSKLE